MKVSFFKTIKNTSPQYSKDVTFFLDRIREGKSKKLIEELRFQVDPEKQKEIKLELPAVRFNGEFLRSGNNYLKKSSGLMILDFDDLENPILFRNELSKDEYIFACWVSPRGNGVKSLIRIPNVDNDVQFKAVFKAVQKRYNNLDTSGKDISRACFESYDPDVYVNLESKKFEYVPDYIEPLNIGTVTNIPITDQDEISNKLMSWFKKHYNQNERNNSLFKLASAFNDFGVHQSTCEMYLKTYEQTDFKELEILMLIESAYKKTVNFNTKQFEDKQKKSQLQTYVMSGKKQNEIEKEFLDIDKEKLKNEVQKIKKELDISVFWEYQSDGKVKIKPYRLKIYLESLHYFKYFPIDSTKPFLLITKNENFIDTVSEFKLKDNLLDNLVDKNNIDVFDVIAEKTRIFTPQYLSMLDTANVEIEKDGKDYAMIYYQNKAVKVFKDKIESYNYDELEGFVWKNQIIKRDFIESDHHDSMFRTFLWLISGKNSDNYNTFKSVIGYLLHSYKTSANNKAIILNDETISDTPNGGSGKGILINAIGHMKRVSTIDGKTFDFNKSFAYQTVSTDCQVLAFDDVKKNFEFERLFSAITEGITIEYKNQGAVKLPVKDSPKLVISTNYTIKTNGGSFERRVFEVELSSYFSANYSPLDEFGVMLFEDWDVLEWARFDQVMINCLQYYLEHGLVSSETKNLELRKFINDTSQEFFEFITDDNILPNERYVKSDIYQKFKDENGELKWLNKRLFNKWVKLYCKYKDWIYEDGNSNGSRWFMLRNDNYVEPVKTPF